MNFFRIFVFEKLRKEVQNKLVKQRVRQCAIRFRKWCRHSYATFAGLKKSITIGTLSTEIADRLMLKSGDCASALVGGSHLSLLQKSMSEVLSNES